MPEPTLTPAHRTIIDALARLAVADYLRAEAARQQAANDARPNPVPLQPNQQAA
jgi:hypothetical protein